MFSVSNNRFNVYGKAYAMGNVTSLKTGVDEANKGIGILLGLITLFVLFAANSCSKYFIGRKSALSSKNKTHIEEVVSALHEAIVSRG